MLPGFNTDFKYRGETYHIQTEDNGLANPVVVTLLYHKGAILASRRTSYRDLAGRPGHEKELVALMKAQHKDLMHALLAGALDQDGAAPAVAGATGEHPADAAAAVAAREAAQAKAQRRAPRVIPVAAAPPAPPAAPAASLAPQRDAAAAPEARGAAPTLDESIRRYLEQFAHTAASAAR